MTAYTVDTIDGLPSIHDGAVKLAGDALGVETFGLQVLDFPAGFSHYPEHDHMDDRQEEVYVVLRGSAEIAVAGESLSANAGTMLRVAPESRRRISPGPEGVRILAIGCVAGAAYERPQSFRVGVAS